ncbi:MAG: tetraacyldisaccharide 4'-kinase [Planctomycetota bacterium]
MNQDGFRKLISGRSAGLFAAVLRLVLRAAARVYSSLVRIRNFLYTKGRLKTHRVDAIVISIGNITTGGTGKTPLVIWLYDKITQSSELKTQNSKCAILTRGYKTKKGKLSGEPAVLAKSCPEAKVIINPDRVAGAAEAVSKWGAKVLIMDDGFQHRRLGRDLDIVTIDAMCPFGYGKVLPAGLLREPVDTLRRADAVVITRCDQVAEAKLDQLEEQLCLINPDISVARSIHAPVCAKSVGGKEFSIAELKDKDIFAFCGIGNPAGFFGTIGKYGFNLAGSRVYNDHHRYTGRDIVDIDEEVRYLGADLIMTTQKDWSKICNSNFSILNSQDIPFIYLVIELKFIRAEDEIIQLIEKVVADKMSRK